MTNGPQIGQLRKKEQLTERLREVRKEIKGLQENPAPRLSREFDLKQMETLEQRLKLALGGQE
jgi:hypothetical protein